MTRASTTTVSVLLFAVGSSKPEANEAVFDLAVRLAQGRRGPVRACFGTCAPGVADVTGRVARAGRDPAAVPRRGPAALPRTRTRVPARLADGRTAGRARGRPGTAALRQRASELEPLAATSPKGSALHSPLALLSWPSRRRTLAAAIHPSILTRFGGEDRRVRDSVGRRQPPISRRFADRSAHVRRCDLHRGHGTSCLATRSWNCRVERIVHGDQRFTFLRPFRAGDVVIATATIDRVRLRAGSELISATVDMSGRDGEQICTAQATFYHAREALA